MFELLITRPLGFIINLIYSLVSNYGVAIILFTIVVKLILLPLNVRSQKAMKKQQKIQPIMAELQKKYANDQEKLQREMMKIYRENNISMTGGCLPMLIQMPILIGLYKVIQRPITYLLGVTDWGAAEVLEKVEFLKTSMVEQFPNIIGNVSSYSTKQIIDNAQIQLSNWAGLINGANDPWVVNFDFLGLDLSQIPSMAFNKLMMADFSDMGVILLLLIPVFAVLTSWLSMKITQMQSGKNNNAPANDQAAQMNRTMNLMMPIMTGFFTITLPSGMGLYWIISSVMQILQQIILNRVLDNKEDEIDVKLPDKSKKKRKK